MWFARLLDQIVDPTLPRSVKLLAAGRVVDSFGSGLVFPLTTLYVVNVLGHDVAWAGSVLFFHSLAATIGVGLAGRVADRIGRKPILMASLLGSSLLAFLLGLWQVAAAFVPLIILMGFSIHIYRPASQALISDLAPGRERQAFGLLYVANNLGVAFGAAVGGALAAWSFRAIFWIDALTYLIFAVVLWRSVPDPFRERLQRGVRLSSRKSEEKVRLSWAQFRQDLHTSGALSVILLGVGSLGLFLAYSQLQTTLPVIMTDQGFSEVQYGLLWSLNAVLVVLLTPVISRLSDRRKWSLSSLLLGSPLAHAAGFVLVLTAYFSPHYLWLLAAMAVVSVGEVLHALSYPTTVARIAPDDRRGAYQGLAGVFGSGGWMLGPALGGWILKLADAPLLWSLAILVPLVGFLVFREAQHLEAGRQVPASAEAKI